MKQRLYLKNSLRIRFDRAIFLLLILPIINFSPATYASYASASQSIKTKLEVRSSAKNSEQGSTTSPIVVSEVLGTNIPEPFYKVTDEGTYIVHNLKTTEKRLFIEAQGDIYLTKRLISSNDVSIATTGNVYIQDDCLCDGSLTIRAKGIIIDSLCEAKGQLKLLSDDLIQLRGSVSSRNIVQLISSSDVTISGMIEADEGILVVAGGACEQRGDVTSRRDLVIQAKAFTQKGTSVSNLKTKITTEDLLFLCEGSSVAGQQLQLASKLKNMHLFGDIYGHDGVQVSAHEEIVLHGQLLTKGVVVAISQNLALHGLLTAEKGATITVEQAWNLDGYCYFGGVGLRLLVGQFENKGHLETTGLGLQVDTGTNHGSIRTRGHATLKGKKFFNRKGSLTFTTGVHQVEFSDTYADAGTFYTPTLFIAQARDIQFLTGHISFLKDALLTSSHDITAQEGTHFKLYGPSIFMQLASDGSVTFRGKAAHDSIAHYPLADYFTGVSHQETSTQGIPMRAHKNTDIDAFRREVEQTAKEHPSTKLKRASGITITVEGDVKFSGSSRIDSGAITVCAGGSFQSEQGSLQAGVFTGNSATIRAAHVALNKSTIKTYADSISLITQGELELQSAELSSGMNTVIQALFAKIEGSSLKSAQGSTDIDIKKTALFRAACLQSAQRTSVQADTIDLHDISVVSGITALVAQDALRVQSAHITSENTLLAGKDVSAQQVSFTGDAALRADNSLTVAQVKGAGRLATKSGGTTTFGDNVSAREIYAEGKKIVVKDTVSGKDIVQLEAETIAQRGHVVGRTVALKADDYEDTEVSRVTAREGLTLKVVNGKGFNGKLKGETVMIEMDDFHLSNLKNIIAHVTQVHTTKDVVIDQDLVLNNTLHLWVNKLVAQGKVTAHGDFMVQASTNILLNGEMDIRGTGAFVGESITSNQGKLSAEKLYLQARTGDVSLYHAILQATTDVIIKAEKGNIKKTATSIAAGNDIALLAAQNIESESVLAPKHSDDDDGTAKDSMHAGRDITAEAGHHIRMISAQNSAGSSITYRAGGSIVDTVLQVVSEHSEEAGERASSSKRVYNLVSDHRAGKKFVIDAGGNLDLYAPNISAESVELSAGGKLSAHEVHDTHESRSEEKHKGGFFGQDREKKSFSFDAVSKGLRIKATISVSIKAHGDVSLTNVSVTAPHISLKSVQGAIKILSGHNQSSASRSEQSSNLAWQSQRSYVANHKTHSASQFDGNLEVSSKEVFVEATREQVNTLVKQLEAQGITALYTALNDLHEIDSKSSQGPSPALAAVVVIAVGICTAGTGAALGAAAAGSIGATGVVSTVISTMTAAAFTSLCCQASLALLSNEGNILKAAESLASTKTLEGLAISMLTAGVTAGFSDVLTIPSATHSTSALHHIERQVLQSTVSTTAGIAQGLKPEEAALRGLKGAAVGAFAAIVATEIGEAYRNHDVDFFGHKVLHALVGGASGALIGEKLVEGALAGAFGAVSAEMLGELVLMNCNTIAEDVVEDLQKKGVSATQENIQAAVREEITMKANFIKLMTSGLALITGQDVSLSVFTASNALDNNFINMACSITELGVAEKIFSESTDFVDEISADDANQSTSSVEPKLHGPKTHAQWLEEIDHPLEEDELANGIMETMAMAGAGKIVASVVRRGMIYRAAESAEKRVAGKIAGEIEKGAANLRHEGHIFPGQHKTPGIYQSINQQEKGIAKAGVSALDEVGVTNYSQHVEYVKELATHDMDVAKVIAGHGTDTELRVAEHLAKEFNLSKEGFQKVVGPSRILPDGSYFEPHGYMHIDRPGEILKTKLKDPGFSASKKTPKDQFSPRFPGKGHGPKGSGPQASGGTKK
jgi:hypothetical protein